MRHAEGLSRGVSPLALPEEHQFEAVAMAVGRVHVARVIPPLGAEIGMLEMVARELVAVAGKRLPVLGEPRPAAGAPRVSLHEPAGQLSAIASQSPLANHACTAITSTTGGLGQFGNICTGP